MGSRGKMLALVPKIQDQRRQIQEGIRINWFCLTGGLRDRFTIHIRMVSRRGKGPVAPTPRPRQPLACLSPNCFVEPAARGLFRFFRSRRSPRSPARPPPGPAPAGPLGTGATSLPGPGDPPLRPDKRPLNLLWLWPPGL